MPLILKISLFQYVDSSHIGAGAGHLHQYASQLTSRYAIVSYKVLSTVLG